MEAYGEKKPAGFTRSSEGALVWGAPRLLGRWVLRREGRAGDPVWENLQELEMPVKPRRMEREREREVQQRLKM